MNKDSVGNHVRKFIESHYSLEQGTGGKYINWVKTMVNIDDELLHKTLSDFERNPPKTLPTSSSFLRTRYEAKVNRSAPMPPCICPNCYSLIEPEQMKDHAPMCSYKAYTDLTHEQIGELRAIHTLETREKAHAKGKEMISNEHSNN